ncbi:MAG: class B sortase [Oscillospiraceae bacterium]|nr:class B sortase [Candidatus Limimonas egerieequi]
MKKRLYTILEVLFIALFIFSLSQLIKIGLNYRRGNQLYEGVQNKVEEVTENKDYHFVVDLTELQKTNEDIVGWIKIPDTPVDYPVLQPDNNQYYLKHTYDNIYSDFGSIFIDNYCSMDDPNTVIYGHNTRNDAMFGSLKKYKDANYFNQHPNVYLLYGDTEKQYQIVAALTVEITDPIYKFQFSDSKEQKQWIEDIYDRAECNKPDMKFTGKEKFITLSTCTSRTKTERFVIVAKEVKTVWAK